MTPVDVLKLIILNDGSCSAPHKTNCKICPLSKLKRRADGSYMNCIEAIGVDGLSEPEADKKYLEKAKSTLLDIEMDNLLENDIEPEQQG